MRKLKNMCKFTWFGNSLHSREEEDVTVIENKLIVLQGGGHSLYSTHQNSLTVSLSLFIYQPTQHSNTLRDKHPQDWGILLSISKSRGFTISIKLKSRAKKFHLS